MSKAVDTLTKAASLVGGDRNKEHGAIAVGFNKTAQLWSAYLNTSISAEQVAIMLTLLKISRTTSGKKLEDHYTDMAGYAAIAGELASSIPEDYMDGLKEWKRTVKEAEKTYIGDKQLLDAINKEPITISIKDMPSQSHSYVVKTPSGKKEIAYGWLNNTVNKEPR